MRKTGREVFSGRDRGKEREKGEEREGRKEGRRTWAGREVWEVVCLSWCCCFCCCSSRFLELVTLFFLFILHAISLSHCYFHFHFPNLPLPPPPPPLLLSLPPPPLLLLLLLLLRPLLMLLLLLLLLLSLLLPLQPLELLLRLLSVTALVRFYLLPPVPPFTNTNQNLNSSVRPPIPQSPPSAVKLARRASDKSEHHTPCAAKTTFTHFTLPPSHIPSLPPSLIPHHLFWFLHRLSQPFPSLLPSLPHLANGKRA